MFRDCTNISFYDGWPFYRESKSNQVNDFAPLFVKAFSAPAYSQRHMICSTQNTALPQERGSSSPTYFQGAWAKTPKTRPLSFPLTLLCSTQALHPPEPPPSPISLPPSAVPQSTSHSSLVPPPPPPSPTCDRNFHSSCSSPSSLACLGAPCIAILLGKALP